MHNFKNFWSIFCINLISEKIAKLSIDYWVQARGQLYTRKEHRVSGKQRRLKSKGDNSLCYYITHIVCLYISLQASLRCHLLSVSIVPLRGLHNILYCVLSASIPPPKKKQKKNGSLQQHVFSVSIFPSRRLYTCIVCLYISPSGSLQHPVLSVSKSSLGVSTMPCIVCIYISLQASLHLYCLSLYSPLGDSTTSYSSSGSKPPGLFSTSLGASYGPVGLCSVSSCLRHTAPCSRPAPPHRGNTR